MLRRLKSGGQLNSRFLTTFGVRLRVSCQFRFSGIQVYCNVLGNVTLNNGLKGLPVRGITCSRPSRVQENAGTWLDVLRNVESHGHFPP